MKKIEEILKLSFRHWNEHAEDLNNIPREELIMHLNHVFTSHKETMLAELQQRGLADKFKNYADCLQHNIGETGRDIAKAAKFFNDKYKASLSATCIGKPSDGILRIDTKAGVHVCDFDIAIDGASDQKLSQFEGVIVWRLANK